MKKLFIVVASVLFLGACAGKWGHRDHNKMWKHMDANSDGEVTKEEFDKAHMKKFEKMDSNKDGKISKDEKMAFHKSKKKNCRKGGCDSVSQ